MTARRGIRAGLAFALVVLLLAGVAVVLNTVAVVAKSRITAYFESANGIYAGDDVKILGVKVGEIETIEPLPERVKVTFWVDRQYPVPADAKALVLSPGLVTARFIQLTPAYTGGPKMADDSVIPQDRTAVPVEFDDLREQLKKLNQSLSPIQPGGVSTLGEFVSTAADNLRGQGGNIRDTVIKLSQSLSILGDHSGDIFGTLKNLSILVSALHDSTDLMRQLNQNLAAVTAVLANDPNEVGTAIADLNSAVTDVRSFVAENRESLGVSTDKLAEITQALGESSEDIKQALHLYPTGLSNFVNTYEPAAATPTGVLSGTNFANPVSFICGAIQAASRLNAEQSAKLCVQYLAPIVKNRQYNFLGPLGFSGAPIPPLLPVGAMARPNEVTYSEDWMRPDYVPPGQLPDAQSDPAASPVSAQAPQRAATDSPPLAAEAPNGATENSPPAATTDPNAGLSGMMVPPGAGS